MIDMNVRPSADLVLLNGRSPVAKLGGYAAPPAMSGCECSIF
jgi:hypothetical protein